VRLVGPSEARGWRLALGRAGESWAGAVRKGNLRAEIQEGREKIVFPFYFPTNFPKSIFKLFLNSFEH